MPISGSLVKGYVIGPTGTIRKLEDNVTNIKGECSFNWTLGEGYDAGTYTIKTNVLKDGLEKANHKIEIIFLRSSKKITHHDIWLTKTC